MTYDEYRGEFTMVSSGLHDQLTARCQRNPWLKVGGIDFEDDPCMEQEYSFSFITTDNLAALEAFFAHGNWSIRNGAVYKDLAFVNQVNGGDEWWTLKRFDNQWVAFESITFGGIIKRGEFPAYLAKLLAAKLNDNGLVSY